MAKDKSKSLVQLGVDRMSPEAKAKREKMQLMFIINMMEHNLLPNELAKKIGKEDPQRAKTWRARHRRWMKDPAYQSLIGEYTMHQFRGSLPVMANALIRRASKGNVPAIKLALEVSGFWNPRTTHDHTGEIAVVLKGGYRPSKVVDDGDIVDATVVEDTSETK